ncbi:MULTISPECIES: EAL domain-containing protein [Thermodesulfobacterium]|uniref:EAL domain-containing protein n=2 Tax=Thermodesulfobacteriaceae TaxID=188711 RepID=UPI0003B4224B|nr:MULTISPECIES: EAL domain-containing protein [Thermodesulfobacterium]MBZ4682468.1 hypothetical protein [Thermodesulfobacterium sp.]
MKSLNLSENEKKEIRLCYSSDETNVIAILKTLRPISYFLSLLEHQVYFEILKNNRLTIYFQPIVDLKNRKIYGFECLTRGVKGNGEILSPGYLFEAARVTDTLFYLDRSCRETAIKLAAVKGLKNYKVFINFLPTVIYDPQFCLQSTIKWAYQLEWIPDNLVFEVVETEKITDLSHLRNILDYYRKNGFQVALDDVGTGYSSLDALINLYPNYIKISRELIREIHLNPIKRDLFKALVEVATAHNILVLAEGVETLEEAKSLYNLGIYLMQGFLFAKPNPEPIYELPMLKNFTL